VKRMTRVLLKWGEGMRTRIFTVSPETWEEHNYAKIAAINDPMNSEAASRDSMGIRTTSL